MPKVVVSFYTKVNDRPKMLGGKCGADTQFTVVFFRDRSLEMSELRFLGIFRRPERFGSVDRHGCVVKVVGTGVQFQYRE